MPASPAKTDTSLQIPEAFGPVSNLELAIEAARLDKARLSIEKHGFLEGHAVRHWEQITSKIFRDNGDFRIVIFEENHRTALLANLGWGLIPVQYQVGFPPCASVT